MKICLHQPWNMARINLTYTLLRYGWPPTVILEVRIPREALVALMKSVHFTLHHRGWGQVLITIPTSRSAPRGGPGLEVEETAGIARKEGTLTYKGFGPRSPR